MSQRQPSELSIRVRQDLPRPLVSVAGELDMASVGLLTATLEHVRRNLHRRTVAVLELEEVGVDVDLTAVTFADSHGLAPVLDSRTRILAASNTVRRVLLLQRDLPLPAPLPPARQRSAAHKTA